MKLVTKQQHIDYEFKWLDDEGDGDNDDDDSDVNDDGELSFDYGQHDHDQDVSTSRNSMEVLLQFNILLLKDICSLENHLKYISK